ncbi:MAG: glycosyltransferase [Gammaproteobacteria bacterium]
MNARAPRGERPIRTLLFSSLYPNAAQPYHGLFVEERLRQLVARYPVSARVCAPVPWFPSANPRFGQYATFANVPAREQRHGLACWHPRYPVLPKIGMSLAPTLMAAALQRPVARELAAAGGVDLIDAHFFYPDGVAATLIGRRLGLPVVITARGSDINLYTRHALPRAQILAAARRAAAIVAVSTALADAIADLGIPRAKIVVLRNGVDLERFAPGADAATMRAARWPGRKVLLTVCHLVPLKGVDVLLRALARLPEAVLVVAGEGPEEPRLRALAHELGVAARVEFEGYVPAAKLPMYYGAADVTLLASSREGMPNVVLESIACGTPVVATAVGGVPEVVCVPEAGRLVRARTGEAFAAAIGELLREAPERAATRRHGATLGWDGASRGQWELFNNVLLARARCAAA